MKYCDTENEYSGTLPIQHPEQGEMSTLNLNLKVFLFSKTLVVTNFIGHESEQAPGVGDGQGGLVCCSPWGRKESDTTEQLI